MASSCARGDPGWITARIYFLSIGHQGGGGVMIPAGVQEMTEVLSAFV